MRRNPLGLSPSIEAFLNAQSPEHPVLQEVHEVTQRERWPGMQIAPSQAAFLTWLLRLLGARRVIEVGVYTGYSSLAMALALSPKGHLLACDVSEKWTAIALKYWEKAGVAERIELVLQPARDTLLHRIRAGESNSYDFAFVDADKQGYPEYFELCLRLLRPGGVIAFDNMLWGGAVADGTAQDADTRTLRELNHRVLSDRRVDASLIAVGDGILLATKR